MPNQQIALDTYGSGEGPEISTILLRSKGWYETMIFWQGSRLNHKFEWSYSYSDALATHALFNALVKVEIERHAGVTQW